MISAACKKILTPRMQVALLVTSTSARLCLGCARNPDAECKKDQTQLLAVMVEDKRVDEVLRKVDATASAGKGPQAAEVIAAEAKPANERALDKARRLKTTTIWGGRYQTELETLMERRRESIFAYELALRSDDLDRIVMQMKSQTDLEKAAISLESKIKLAPRVESGECAPKH